MIYLKTIFLFVAGFLAATAAEPPELFEGPILNKWDKDAIYKEYTKANSHLPFFGLLHDYKTGPNKASLTIRVLRQYGMDQGWSVTIESRTEDKGGAINFAAADFLQRALPAFLEDPFMREKLIRDMNTLLHPEGHLIVSGKKAREERLEEKMRPLTSTERMIALKATLWTVAYTPLNLQHSFKFGFWNESYFPQVYEKVASPTLKTRAIAAALAVHHILGQGNLEEIRDQSGVDAQQFTNLLNEVVALIYEDGALAQKIEALRTATQSKGLEHPTHLESAGDLAPLFTGEGPTSPYAVADVALPISSHETDSLLPSQNMSCWKKYRGTVCGGVCVAASFFGLGALVALASTGNL